MVSTKMRNSSVVGYQEAPLVTGYNLFSPTFVGVGKKLDIQDIKLVGAAEEGADVIWILNSEDGNITGETYIWVPAEAVGNPEAGWFDGEKMAEREITEGEGFYIQAQQDCSIRYSGEVKLGGYTRDLVAGVNLIGNCTPAPLPIQKMKLVGSAEEGADVIWILNSEDGNVTGETYIWVPAEAVGNPEAGWFDGEKMADWNIPAGQGLYIQIQQACKVTIPSAITK